MAVGLLALAGITGGAWYLMRGESSAAPASAPRIDGPRANPAPLAEAEPVALSGARQGEIVKGALIFPDSDRRLLTSGELAGLSREQLQRARAEIQARHHHLGIEYRLVGGAQAALNEVETANLRLIEEAEKAR